MPRPPQALTILGTVAADELGFVLPHEHVRIDNALHHAPVAGLDPHAPVTASMSGDLRVWPHAVIGNLVLDDDDAVLEDLRHFRRLGGQTLVDLTPRGMGRDPAHLAAVARSTGLHLISGTGYYVARAHGALVAGRSVEELAADMVGDLTAGTHAAGVIGEIGVSAEPHPHEWRVLSAALEAQRQTGAPVWIHLTTLAPLRAVLDRLDRANVDPRRIVLCHTDYDLRSLELHRAALDMGLVVEMDLFGFPAWNRGNFLHAPDDRLRVASILALAAEGFERQLLMSQDVCLKTQLRRFGGFGYSHILAHVKELFEALGGGEDLWRRITVETPARLLGWR